MRNSTTLMTVLAMVIAVSGLSTANAATITGVTLDYPFPNHNSTRAPIHSIDGSGLVAGLHDRASNTRWEGFISEAPVITFDLEAEYDLDSLDVWNMNFQNDTDRAIKDVTISVAGFDEVFSSLGGFVFAEPPNGTDPTAAENIAFSQSGVRYVRLAVTTNYGDPDYVGLSEIQFNGALSDPQSLDPQRLGQGHRVLLDRGLQIQTYVDVLTERNFDLARWTESNFTTVNFQYSPYPTIAQVPSMGGVSWGRSMHGQQFDILDARLYPQELPFASDMVNFQMKDEQDITDPANLAQLVEMFRLLRDLPYLDDVILHTSTGGSATVIENYMSVTQPDMLMFAEYAFRSDPWDGGSPTRLYEQMQKYRVLGLAGNDGTGAQPIPTAIYTQTYPPGNGHIVSESEIRLNNFAAWALGYKFVDSFTYNYEDFNVFFSGPGTSVDNPTDLFFQAAETNRQSLNLGPALVRLLSTDIRFISGEHEETIYSNGVPIGTEIVPNDQPGDEGPISSWNSNADPYITNISATNLGTKNDGLKGDVILGYYKPLDAVLTNPGFEDDIYFMVLNGLSDPIGTPSETTQQIRLDFDFAASGIDSLQRLSRDTGLVETVNLISDGGSLYHLDLILDGGTGDLFKFNNGGVFTLPRTAGDFNADGFVTTADFDIMKAYWLTTGNIPNTNGEVTGDGIVNLEDFKLFKDTLFTGPASALGATIPEPNSLVLLLAAFPAWLAFRSRRRNDVNCWTSPRGTHI